MTNPGARERLIALAEQIVDDLFVNGAHERADRLVLTVDGPPKRDLGGWSRRPMVDRIVCQLAEAASLLAASPPRKEHETEDESRVGGQPESDVALPRGTA